MEQFNNMSANFNAHGLDGATIAIKQLAAMAQKQAMILSFADVFVILTVLFLSLILGVMMINKPQGVGPSGGGH
ncbi:hypothetical protein D3C72_2316960 [compost metagenome]